ncbi:MAG TPA: HypC/HybG/HupF family hydrogenase formation chaperone [Anaerolineaceae bacterium]|nr:HypC/HybG/HupF family hydrogenase formation chaperone [Anaerolineaceae bacterium]
MCLAVPGKVVEISEKEPILMGKIDFDGVIREVCLEAVPEVKLGDYVIVHAGFALNVLSEQEAQESLQAFRELDEIENNLTYNTDLDSDS